jgi:uncharacterized protein YciI
MKAVVTYELGAAPMDAIVATFPRHKALIDIFAARRDVIAIGNFAGGQGGAMGVFRNRQAAESFVNQDPFVLEGLVGKYTIRDWNEILLP